MTCYRRVTFETRCQIRAYLESGICVKEIAEKLRVHRSTVYREIKRNSCSGYDPKLADRLAKERFARCRKRRKFLNARLRIAVFSCLQEGWSPEQAAGRIEKEGLPAISHQTIYNEIKRSKPKWAKYLRRHGKRRGRGRARRRRHPSWMKTIDERPKDIALRKTFGHWERDTMFAKDRRQLLVFAERKSRFVKLAKMKSSSVNSIAKQSKELLARTKKKAKSLTNDNGNEFMDAYLHKLPVYYCDPHSPHQKGGVENAIGLLRQYLPKQANLERISPQKLSALERKLNLRPRKCLDYRTPYEVLYGKTVALVT